MPHHLPPADLTVFAVAGTAAEGFVPDAQELCFQSFVRNHRRSLISLIFLEDTTRSTGAAAYRPNSGMLPPQLQGKVSLWSRTDPEDRAMVIPSLDKELVGACIHYLEQTPSLDCRIVTVTATDTLAEHIQEACTLAFRHLPVYSDDNVQRSVDYAMSLLGNLSTGIPSPKQVNRPATVARTTVGYEDEATASRLFLRSRGRPVRFAAPFVHAGFSINSRIVREIADGALVTNAAQGAALYGPYLPVAPGSYQALIQIRGEPEESSRLMNIVRRRPSGSIALDAFLPGVDRVLEIARVDAANIGPDPVQLRLGFAVPEFPELAERPKLELRVHQQSNKSCVIEFIELTWLTD